MKHRDVYEDLDLVFANEIGHAMLRENVNVRHFSKIIKAARVSTIRFYDLRDTMATLLFLKDVHPKIVSERLDGSVVMDIYSQALPTMQHDATGRFERLMAG